MPIFLYKYFDGDKWLTINTNQLTQNNWFWNFVNDMKKYLNILRLKMLQFGWWNICWMRSNTNRKYSMELKLMSNEEEFVCIIWSHQRRCVRILINMSVTLLSALMPFLFWIWPNVFLMFEPPLQSVSRKGIKDQIIIFCNLKKYI